MSFGNVGGDVEVPFEASPASLRPENGKMGAAGLRADLAATRGMSVARAAANSAGASPINISRSGAYGYQNGGARCDRRAAYAAGAYAAGAYTGYAYLCCVVRQR